jgi:glutathione synthase/RimK-type ligase-like ATP-grasp enzyme
LASHWIALVLLAAVAGILALRPADRPGSGGDSPVMPQSALILNGETLLGPAGDPGGLCLDGFETVFRSIDQLAFTVETGQVRVCETVDGRDLADFGLVQVAGFPRPTGTLLNAVAAYLENKGVLAVNAEGVGAPTKLLQYVRFAQAGLPVPATRYIPPQLIRDAYPDLASAFGLPFLLSTLTGSGGGHDILITTSGDFAEQIPSVLRHPRAMFLAQEIIPSDSTFYLLILGDEAPIVIRQGGIGSVRLRGAQPDRQAALIEPTTFDPGARRLAVQAASLMGFDIAGVNLIQHWTTGQWYVLDACASPAISAGVFVPDKLGAYSVYLKRKLGVAATQKYQRR